MPKAQHIGRVARSESASRGVLHTATGRGIVPDTPEEERFVHRGGDAPDPDRRGGEMLEGFALSVGRMLFGGYFLYNGLNHFLQRDSMAEYARAKHVPMPEAAVLGTGAMLVLGGLSLLTGRRPKTGASLITMFLAGVTPQMHAFWRIEDQGEQMQEFINFTKNMALVGGAALAAAQPEPWPISLDRSR